MNPNISKCIQAGASNTKDLETAERVIEKFKQLSDLDKMYILGRMDGLLLATEQKKNQVEK